MSETTPQDEQTPEEEAAEFGRIKKRLGVRPKTRAAMIEVLERRKQGRRPGYKMVALRHGISWQSLKTAIQRFDAGEITLGMPESPEDVALDIRVETRRTMDALSAYEQMLVESVEGLIARSREFAQKGKFLSYRDMGLHLVVNDLKAVKSLRTIVQKDLVTILREAMKEKEVKRAVADVEGKAVSAIESEDRAADVLRRRKELREAQEVELRESKVPEPSYDQYAE